MFGNDEPLGLPDGSVRAVITLMFSAVTCFLFATTQPIPEGLMAINLVVIYSYFQKRQDDDKNKPEPLPEPTVLEPED